MVLVVLFPLLRRIPARLPLVLGIGFCGDRGQLSGCNSSGCKPPGALSGRGDRQPCGRAADRPVRDHVPSARKCAGGRGIGMALALGGVGLAIGARLRRRAALVGPCLCLCRGS